MSNTGDPKVQVQAEVSPAWTPKRRREVATAILELLQKHWNSFLISDCLQVLSSVESFIAENGDFDVEGLRDELIVQGVIEYVDMDGSLVAEKNRRCSMILECAYREACSNESENP